MLQPFQDLRFETLVLMRLMIQQHLEQSLEHLCQKQVLRLHFQMKNLTDLGFDLELGFALLWRMLLLMAEMLVYQM